MEHYEFESLTPFNIKETLAYVSNSIVIKHILNAPTGNIMVLALDYGKVYEPKGTPFSTFIKVLEGKAEVVIDNVSTYFQNGDCMIVPGHVAYTIEANERFKMLTIVLKSSSGALES